MKKSNTQHFGDLDPRYHYSLNPYPDLRFSGKCPTCGGKTGQKTLPLLIHVDPQNLITLNYTNRYCRRCDTLIGHKDEIEHLLFAVFSQSRPDVVGNPYVMIGTVETKACRKALTQPQPVTEIRKYAHDFETFEELRMTMAGWFHKDQEPPVWQPPPSAEWVKR